MRGAAEPKRAAPRPGAALIAGKRVLRGSRAAELRRSGTRARPIDKDPGRAENLRCPRKVLFSAREGARPAPGAAAGAQAARPRAAAAERAAAGAAAATGETAERGEAGPAAEPEAGPAEPARAGPRSRPGDGRGGALRRRAAGRGRAGRGRRIPALEERPEGARQLDGRQCADRGALEAERAATSKEQSLDSGDRDAERLRDLDVRAP